MSVTFDPSNYNKNNALTSNTDVGARKKDLSFKKLLLFGGNVNFSQAALNALGQDLATGNVTKTSTTAAGKVIND